MWNYLFNNSSLFNVLLRKGWLYIGSFMSLARIFIFWKNILFNNSFFVTSTWCINFLLWTHFLFFLSNFLSYQLLKFLGYQFLSVSLYHLIFSSCFQYSFSDTVNSSFSEKVKTHVSDRTHCEWQLTEQILLKSFSVSRIKLVWYW